MQNDKIIKVLISLTQLDIDAVHAYEQALKNIDDKEIYKMIESFMNDHLRHISELSHEIRTLGGISPEHAKDFKGYLIEGFTAIRSLTGTEGALKAMETNEALINKSYKDTLTENEDMPVEIRALIQRNYADEQRHLTYIRSTVKMFVHA